MNEPPVEQSVEALLDLGVRSLTSKTIESARLDARLLLAAVLGRQASQLVMELKNPVSLESLNKFNSYLERRKAGEPVSRILGEREFWSLSFLLSADTLDPRPDSETVIDVALKLQSFEGSRPLRVLDLGTGTGCLLLSLLHEWPNAEGIGVDCSPGALKTARANAKVLGFDKRASFLAGNWLEPVLGAFDVVVSNPPYIPESDLGELQIEVRLHDPVKALDGGSDGLIEYRRIARDVSRVLVPDGVVIFEIGFDQENEVRAILANAGLSKIASHRDLSGHVRCISAVSG